MSEDILRKEKQKSKKKKRRRRRDRRRKTRLGKKRETERLGIMLDIPPKICCPGNRDCVFCFMHFSLL